MKPYGTTLIRLLLALAIVSCERDSAGPDAGGELTFATATPTCGPAGGGAMAITATEVRTDEMQPAGAYLRVFFWKEPRDVAGRTWQWSADTDSVSAFRCDAAGVCLNATAGTVVVGSFAADSSLGVRLDVTFGNSSRVRRTLEARWIPRDQLICI